MLNIGKILSILGLLALSITAQAATSYTYTYNGPAFIGSADHLSVSFSTATALAPSTSYINPTAAGVTSSSVSVVGSTTIMTLPVSNFQVHTNAAGSIDSWNIMGDISALSGSSPTMTGTHQQAYTMNTLVFIPGSDIPGAIGLVTGPYAYDQGTQTTFYASCTGAPAGCTLAGNGQPYVGNYSGIINPSRTNGSWWAVTVNGLIPPSSCSGTDAVITSVGRDFIVVNGGLNLADHVWYTPTPAGTTFTGGTTTFATGELVTFSGTLDPVAGCYATTMTVMPAYAPPPAPVLPPVAITTSSLSAGQVGSTYNATLAATGGDGTYSFSIAGLPTGLSLNGATLSGVPANAATSLMTVTATDGTGLTATTVLTLTINPAPAPAPSPQTCVAPAGSKKSAGKGMITSIGSGSFVVGGKTTVNYQNCTAISWNRSVHTLRLGDKVEWKGYSAAGTITATSFTLN